MKQWYVVHTLPNSEEKALCNLMNQGFQAFLPRFQKLRRHARKVESVLAPLFPRYLFVALELSTDRWLSIDSTKGVAYLLRSCGKPSSVPLGTIEALYETSDLKSVVPLSSLSLFKPGSTLEVKEGPFAGYTGVFEKMKDLDRVNVLLNFLGREVKMDFPLAQVQAME